MLSNPSLSWQKIQDVYYSIRHCYDLQWPVENLNSNYRVAISTNTTLIALASKFVPHPNVIDIYSIAGAKMWSLVYNSTPQDHIVDFCFHNENLCVVLSNRRFRLYTDFQGTFNEYPYAEKASRLDNVSDINDDGDKYVITNLENNETEQPFHVLETKTWGQFLMLRFHNRITLTSLDTFQNYEVPFGRLDSAKIHCVSLLSVDDGSLLFLLSYAQTVHLVNVDLLERSVEFIDEVLTDGPFSHMSVSANGALVALFNSESSRIFVIRKEFDRILLEYDTSNESSVPYMVEWAGNDAIILSLRDEIKLIGPRQRSISFFYDIIEQDDFDIGVILNESVENDLSFTIPIIKSEKDGLKIITSKKVEFLSRVPEASMNLHLLGSSHPSLILLDCVDKLSLQSSKADTNISLLISEGSLRTAMKGCLEAALEEFSPLWQKKILKAVSFGKIYEKNYDAAEYLKVLNTIKVLNQIRSPDIGIFLTYKEIVEIGWIAVIEMLLKRSQHLLALRVIDLLDMPKETSLVYAHWCCSKIRKELNMSDVELFKIISERLLSALKTPSTLAKRNYISVSQISDVAFQEGRVDLCKLLINLEPSILKKVNQFLKIEEAELALTKSFQTSDYDLCRLILLHLKDKLSPAQLFRILDQNEQKGLIKDSSIDKISTEEEMQLYLHENLFISGDLIGNFWEQNIAKNDLKLLDSYYKHENKNTERATMKLKEILNLPPLEEVNGDGDGVYDNYYQSCKTKIQGLSGNRKLSKLLQQELEVLDLKRRLSETFQQSFFNEKSLAGIVERLVKIHQLKPALKIVKDFKIGQDKFWNIVLDTYCRSQDFDRLNRFILASNPNLNTWRSPIGFESIAETCMAYGYPQDQVSIYISHCTDATYTRRVELYLQNDDIIQAAEEALRNKDGVLLQSIYRRAQGRDENIVGTIKNYLTRLGFSV